MTRAGRAGFFLMLGLTAGCGGRPDEEASVDSTVLATMERGEPYGSEHDIHVDGNVVIWNDNRQVLGVDVEARAATELYRDPLCASLYGLALDADNLYFGRCSTRDLGVADYLQAFSRSSLQGTDVDRETTLDVAVLAGDVFTVGGGTTIARVSSGESSRIEVPGAAGLYGILAAGSSVVAFENEATWLVEVTSGDVSLLAPGRARAIDDEHVVVVTAVSGADVVLESISLVDGSATELVRRPAGSWFPGAALAGSTVYYTWHDGHGAGEVGSVSLKGEDARVIARAPSPGSIACDDDALYWEDHTRDVAQLHRRSR